MEYSLENKDGVEVEFEIEFNIDPGERMIMNPPDRAHPGCPAHAEITNDTEIQEVVGREITEEEWEAMEEAVMDYANDRSEDAKADYYCDKYHEARDEGLI